MRIVVLKERAEREQRVALVPESAARLAKAGAVVSIEAGAGAAAGFPDAQYIAAGVTVGASPGEAIDGAEVVLTVQPPDSTQIELIPNGAVLISLMPPAAAPEVVPRLAARQVTSLALERVPRITRAQSMDMLSSQATVAGYKAVLLGASHMRRLMPMLTTAAGSLTPAKAFIIGAGVAGLQAIATARRLGAVVSAFDVRPRRERTGAVARRELRRGRRHARKAAAATRASRPTTSRRASSRRSPLTSRTWTW